MDGCSCFSICTRVIKEIRVEKERPLGFENVSVETEDPQYENTPLNINTFAIVKYQFQNHSYSAEIVSWNEEVSWKIGDTIPLFFLETEPEYPTDYISENESNGKTTAITPDNAKAVEVARVLAKVWTCPEFSTMETLLF